MLCDDPALNAKSFCLPSRADALLRTGKFEILRVKKPTQGTGGSRILFLKYPDDHLVIKAKWKASAKGGHSFNNEPRKEIAAYKAQLLFLTPEESVVPPTVGRCIATATFREKIGPGEETFEGAPCDTAMQVAVLVLLLFRFAGHQQRVLLSGDVQLIL